MRVPRIAAILMVFAIAGCHREEVGQNGASHDPPPTDAMDPEVCESLAEYEQNLAKGAFAGGPAIMNLAHVYARKSPDAGLEWLAGLTDPFARKNAWLAFVTTIYRESPERAFKLYARIPEGESRGAFLLVLCDIASREDLPKLWDLTLGPENVSPQQEEVKRALFHAHARYDREEAIVFYRRNFGSDFSED